MVRFPSPGRHRCDRSPVVAPRREEAIQRGLKVRLAQLAEDRERRARAAAAEDGAFTAEFMAAARKVFDLIDTDASGLLDHDEIKTGVTSNQEVIAFVKDCGNQNLQDLLVPEKIEKSIKTLDTCLLYTSPSPRDGLLSRMPSSA